MLLENGAWVNVKNWYDYTPLHFACENYCDGMVRLLLHYRAHIFARTVFGKTPLLRAVKFGNVGDVALLLETVNYYLFCFFTSTNKFLDYAKKKQYLQLPALTIFKTFFSQKLKTWLNTVVKNKLKIEK